MSLLWSGFLLGCVFGVAARLGRFCLLRGLRQAMGRDSAEAPHSAPALQAFALALAMALLASQGLALAGLVDLGEAQVVRSQFALGGSVVGGVLFGLGMVLARSCGARALVLLAGGNLRSLVTVVFLALGAQACMTGVLAPLRQGLNSLWPMALAHATLPQQLQASGWSATAAYALGALVPAALLLAYALWRPALRRSPLQWSTALVVGLLVAAGWWVSATIDVDPFDPAKLSSLSFVGPIAEGLLYLQLAVGRELSLGPALAFGVLVGAAVAALASRTAQWEGFDSPARLVQSAAGGLLMGFGGVLAAGCSIGQGLTGLSTLAFASLPAVAGIVLGALAALRLQPRAPG
jgi:uncharacterized membrane protein YedE/YeeE